MRPRLPQRISVPINQISAATWNSLIDCLAYAMTHPRGDGMTVFNHLGDILSADRSSGSSGVSGTAGLFQVTIDENKKLAVGNGFVNRNGLDFSEYPGGTVTPANGYLCICSEPADKLGNWTGITAMIKEHPNQCAYPIAKITVSGEGVMIEQYPVIVAQICYSGRCPIAEL